MYRHTTPTRLKYLLENNPDRESKIPLAYLEFEVEGVFGDYPGKRKGTGRYCDISVDGVPVGRLWGTDKAVGLLHVPVTGYSNKVESEIQYWNVSADIRLAYHLKTTATQAFDDIVAKYDHTTVNTGDIEDINYPEIDAIFYTGIYDPKDKDVWCEEMK